jgi:hypothetical protein
MWTDGGLSKQFWISLNEEFGLHNRPGSTFRTVTLTTDYDELDLWLRVTRDELRIRVGGGDLYENSHLRNRERDGSITLRWISESRF